MPQTKGYITFISFKMTVTKFLCKEETGEESFLNIRQSLGPLSRMRSERFTIIFYENEMTSNLAPLNGLPPLHVDTHWGQMAVERDNTKLVQYDKDRLLQIYI